MDQHAGRIALRPSQLAMFDGGGGCGGVIVLSGQVGFAQTYYQIVNQLRKMSGTFVIAKMKMVEFGGAFCSRQPIPDEGSFAACQDCGHALPARRLWSIVRQQSPVCDWYCAWSSHLTSFL
jgi:hypothetical protein